MEISTAPGPIRRRSVAPMNAFLRSCRARQPAKWNSRPGKRCCIRKAVRAANGIGRHSILKPLQQRFGLWMVGKLFAILFNSYGEALVSQSFYRVADFQIVLASSGESRSEERRV